MRNQIRQLTTAVGALGVLLFCMPDAATAQVIENGNAIVNSTTANSQQNPDVAADTSGNYVVVWESFGQDGDGYGIYMQRFNSSGVAQGTETLVNSTTSDHQRFPAVAMSNTGAYVVAWMSYDQDGDGWGVYHQRYNSSGAAQGSETKSNSTTTGQQKFPDVAMRRNGRYCIIWQDVNASGEGTIYARGYSSSGSASSASQIDATTTEFSAHPAIGTAKDNGNFLAVWQREGSDGDGNGIYATQLSTSGATSGSEILVNTTTAGNQEAPDVALDTDNTAMVVWTSYGQDGDASGIYGQRFTSFTTPDGSEFLVNPSTTGAQQFASIDANLTGYMAVSWDDYNLDGSYAGVYYTGYDSLGVRMDNEIHDAGDNATNFQQHSAVAMGNRDKNLVIAWMDGLRNSASTNDGDDYGVYSQRSELGQVLTLVMDSDSVSCNGLADGVAYAIASGGYTSYTYSWSNGGSSSSTTVGAGTYTVTVTDNKGYTVTSSVIVPEPAALISTAATDANVTCFGGSDGAVAGPTVGGTMPYGYLWSTGGTDSTETGLAAGTYTVTATDANGCTATSSTTVSDGVNVNVTMSNDGNVTCNGNADGAVSVTPTSGTSPYTYLWSNAASAASNTGLAGGTYTVTVTDASGCTETGSETVTEPDALAANVAIEIAISCPDIDDGSVSATPTGGTTAYTYLWSTGSTDGTLTDLGPGTYTATVTDANGCTDSGSATLVSASSVPTTQLATSSCGITLTDIGSYIYVQAVSGADRYLYEVSDGMGMVEEVFSLGAYPGSTFFSLSWVSGVTTGVTYDIRVKARVGTCWGDYSTVCQVTTPANIGTTTLSAAYCGITLGAVNDYFYIDGVSSATNYSYEISDGASFLDTVYSLSGYASATWYSLAFVNGIDYATTYDVRVRAKVGGVWGDFGAACQLTTPASVLPQVQASYCGNTLASIGQFFYIDAIPGAQRYQYQITDGGSFTAYGFSYYGKPSSTWFSFNLVSGIQASTTYDVSVRTKIANVWGTYGPTCAITTPVSKAGYQPLWAVDANGGIDVMVFPNPTRGITHLAISGPETETAATISVVNMSGQQMLQKTSVISHGAVIELDETVGWAAGIYMVKVQSDTDLVWKRFVVD